MDDPLASSSAVGDLVLDPADHNTIYAATGDNIFSYPNSGVGIFRSTDAGAHWVLLPPGPISQYRAAAQTGD